MCLARAIQTSSNEKMEKDEFYGPFGLRGRRGGEGE